MNTLTFPRGGVHPAENKKNTNQKNIEAIPLPKKVIIPLIQHIGAPAKAIVNVGDKVLKGQRIAEPSGYVSVAYHASTSGTVTQIASLPHPFGDSLPAIVIESDGEDQWMYGMLKKVDPMGLSVEQIRETIQNLGIVGLGGAAFPTHVKLNPPKEMKIDTFILNGVECEPYLTADHRIMLEDTRKIIQGIKIFMKVLGVSNGYIGIEENKPDAIELMKKETFDLPDIKVVALKLKYPQGGEKQLIKAITGREVPSGGLPGSVGCVVQNAATAAAVADAVCEGIPLIERVATITGDSVNEPKNVRFRIGTPISEIIDFCGGLKEDTAKVIMGGPMMGIAQYRLDVPAIKGTSGLLCLGENMVSKEMPTVCIKCARCVDACPIGLIPTTIGRLSQLRRFDDAKDFNALDCIECGCCSYGCPSKIQLVQQIRTAKTKITAKLHSKKK